jgi:tRNA dimethylallyltransferase
MLMKKKLISIVGPTGIGKTALAIELAQHFNTEIISADSRQFFHELNIGVARPTDIELAAAPHHFIAHRSIEQEYSAGMFAKDARTKIDELHQSNDAVIMVGGSGMYVDAVLKGLDDLPSDSSIRAAFNEELEKYGLLALQEKLKEKDPEYFQKVDISNPHRVVRALEVIEVSGKKFSELRSGSQQELPFDSIVFCLTAERDFLYERINSRVDAMLHAGLLDEAKNLYSKRHLQSLNTVGYKEIFEYIDGTCTLEFAIDKIKQHSRNYAKRQITWWKRDLSISWIHADAKSSPLKQVLDFMK